LQPQWRNEKQTTWYLPFGAIPIIRFPVVGVVGVAGVAQHVSLT
jgi:hypothetical protein